MTPRAILGRLRDSSGAAMVEFALVLPLLLLVLLGMFDFGKAFNYWIDETHLANEAARWAVVDRLPSGSSLQSYIRSQADSAELRNGGTGSVPSSTQVCVSFPNGSSNVGDPVKVTVSVAYHWLPFLRDEVAGLSPAATITGSSVMRLEAKPTTYTAGCA